MDTQNEPPKQDKFIEHVKINCADVVWRKKQTDPESLRLYWDMQDHFGDRQYGYEVCLHEAAHAVLMEQGGINNVRFSGPEIFFDPAQERFVGVGEGEQVYV